MVICFRYCPDIPINVGTVALFAIAYINMHKNKIVTGNPSLWISNN